MKSIKRGGTDAGAALLALIDADEFADPIDRHAAATTVMDAIAIFISANTKR